MADELTGRELDREVARRLFGWTPGRVSDVELAEAHAAGVPPREGPWWCPPLGSPAFSWHDDQLPDYSGSWSGAGLVIEEMRRRGWKGVLQTYIEGHKYRMTLVHHDVPGGPSVAQDESVGVAVCRAALNALAAEPA